MTDTVPVRNSKDAIDPTANVIALVKANQEHDRELRLADMRYISDSLSAESRRLDDMAKLRSDFEDKLLKAEAARLDSIRQVDREEVAKTAITSNAAVQTLAIQTAQLRDTLSKQVTETAIAQEARALAVNNEVNKRLSALELASSEGKGKSGVEDPLMKELAASVKVLVDSQAHGSGKTEGAALTWQTMVTIIVVVSALIGIIFKFIP